MNFIFPTIDKNKDDTLIAFNCIVLIEEFIFCFVDILVVIVFLCTFDVLHITEETTYFLF